MDGLNLNKSVENFKDSTKEFTHNIEDLLEDFNYTKNIETAILPQKYMIDSLLTPEQIEKRDELFKQTFETGVEKLNLATDEVEKLSKDILNYTLDVTNQVYEEIGDKTPSFDYESIGKSASSGAAMGGGVGAAFGSFGGGVGAVPGGIAGAFTGAISGVTGEVARQIAIHNGASDAWANGIKFGVEVVTATGVSKIALKGAEKLVSTSGQALTTASETKAGEIVVKQYDDIARYSVDKIKTIGFEAKGIVNNLKIHEFVDGFGKPLFAKIDEVVDITRTIKMPYLGSHLDNTNAAGFLRDSSKFAKQYAENFSETLSKFNLERCQNGLAPIVDKQWLKFNPNHTTFIGQKLQHHHINNTNIAAYVPQGLHNGVKNHSLLHVDDMILGKEVVDLIKQQTGRS
ncbi:MAG: hypothetical protein ACERKK_08665 [Poseidonibacter sp.]|uniref:hypothetical protein n=1 Tax=Poseidonibacter sp. TaxID=2321188 RepID=UPI00359EB299